MVGAWTCVVRFACHAPMGMMAFGGRDIYNFAKSLADTGIYDVIPNGHTFLSGLQMYSTWVRPRRFVPAFTKNRLF